MVVKCNEKIMSDVMLHGVLNMPPELWKYDALDEMQRHSRYYVQASKRINDLNKALIAMVTANNNWRLYVSDNDEILIDRMLRECEYI